MSMLGKTVGTGAVTVGLLVAAFALTSPAAGAATPVGCDLDVLVPWGPEDPVELAENGMTDDGSQLVFSSARGHGEPSDGNDEIWRYDRDAEELEALTDLPNGSGSSAQAMFADGGDVVFYERRTGFSQVRMVDVETGTDVAITPPGEHTNLLGTAMDAPVAVFASWSDEDTAQVERYEVGSGLETLEDTGVGQLLDESPTFLDDFVPDGTVSPDGSTALAFVYDFAFGPVGGYRAHVWDAGGTTLLGRADDAQLVGTEPRLLYSEGERYTHAATLNPFEASVLQTNLATDTTTELVPDGVLRDAGADGDHLLVGAAHGEANEPGAYLQPERHTVETG
jgi:hypothetical protein